MSNDKTQAQNELLNEIGETLLTLSKANLEELLGVESLDEHDMSGTRTVIESALRFSDSPLIAARESYVEELRAIEEGNEVDDMSADDAKNFIVNLMQTGQLDSALTLQFREGESMPDEMLVLIAKRLKRQLEEKGEDD